MHYVGVFTNVAVSLRFGFSSTHKQILAFGKLRGEDPLNLQQINLDSRQNDDSAGLNLSSRTFYFFRVTVHPLSRCTEVGRCQVALCSLCVPV